MELLWLPFALATILLYGIGQVFAKETRTNIPSGNYMLLFGANVFALFGAYWLLFHGAASYPVETWLLAAFAAALSGFAYVTYYEAMKHGKISIIGTVSAAYAPWTVILALVFLGESVTASEGVGVVLVVSSVLMFTYSPNGSDSKRTEFTGIAFAVCSLFLWGTSAAISKSVLTEIGDTNFMGVFCVVCPTIWVAYWLTTTKGRFEMPKTSRSVLEISMLFIAAGGVTMYLAFANGPVSIVTPVTNLYPIVTVVGAKLRLKEKLTRRQYMALGLLFASILLFSL